MDLSFKRRSRDALVRELEAAGGKVKGSTVVCPFHLDRRPSAGIFEKNGVWRFKCQAVECGFGGDIFDVRARAAGRDPVGSRCQNADAEDTCKHVRCDEGPRCRPQGPARANRQ